jgi:hypothetical protein
MIWYYIWNKIIAEKIIAGFFLALLPKKLVNI